MRRALRVQREKATPKVAFRFVEMRDYDCELRLHLVSHSSRRGRFCPSAPLVHALQHAAASLWGKDMQGAEFGTGRQAVLSGKGRGRRRRCIVFVRRFDAIRLSGVDFHPAGLMPTVLEQPKGHAIGASSHPSGVGRDPTPATPLTEIMTEDQERQSRNAERPSIPQTVATRRCRELRVRQG